jgi:hypothetical protein
MASYTPEANWNSHKIPSGIKLNRLSKFHGEVLLNGKLVGTYSRDKVTGSWSGKTTRGKIISDQTTRLAVTDFLTGQAHYSPNTNTTVGNPGKASSNTKPKPSSKPSSKPAADSPSAIGAAHKLHKEMAQQAQQAQAS